MNIVTIDILEFLANAPLDRIQPEQAQPVVDRLNQEEGDGEPRVPVSRFGSSI